MLVSFSSLVGFHRVVQNVWLFQPANMQSEGMGAGIHFNLARGRHRFMPGEMEISGIAVDGSINQATGLTSTKAHFIDNRFFGLKE